MEEVVDDRLLDLDLMLSDLKGDLKSFLIQWRDFFLTGEMGEHHAGGVINVPDDSDSDDELFIGALVRLDCRCNIPQSAIQ